MAASPADARRTSTHKPSRHRTGGFSKWLSNGTSSAAAPQRGRGPKGLRSAVRLGDQRQDRDFNHAGYRDPSLAVDVTVGDSGLCWADQARNPRQLVDYSFEYGILLDPDRQLDGHQQTVTAVNESRWVAQAHWFKIRPDFFERLCFGPSLVPPPECQPQGRVTDRGPFPVIEPPAGTRSG